MEDDKIWHRQFSLAQIRQRMKEEQASQYVFYHIPTAGSTTPSFWEQDGINVLLDNAPKPYWKIAETVWVRIAKKYNIKSIGPTKEELGKQLRRRLWEGSYWVDWGKVQLRRMGVPLAHPARRYFDKETGSEFRNREPI
jgi:hypothetical protein